MNFGEFDGQQNGEVVLARIKPDQLIKYLSFGMLFILAFGFVLVCMGIGSFVTAYSNQIMLSGIVFGLLVILIGFFFITSTFDKSVTYLTDRRVIRFMALTPFSISKRALFWTETLKAKAYTANLLTKMLGIGVVEIESQTKEIDNITIKDVTLYEDLANYIDKILYTVKSSPQDMASMRPFVSRPRGERY